MKIFNNFIIPVALLATFSCSEPKNSNVVDIRPGAPLFPSAPAVSQQDPSGATAGLNPAHGQPGHDCAKPVGAPLNAAPAPALNAATGNAAAVTPVGPAAAPVAVTPAPLPVSAPAGTGAGINPAHGQPGHDCAVAVGAPLNSKASPGANALVTPTALPVAAPGKTLPGTNPAHGQPGHDCAVAVGAPLKTK
jgi:hypothetical protein